MLKLNRRTFLRCLPYGAPLACAADAFLAEPKWVRITRKTFSAKGTRIRFVHFTDLHFKGDESYLKGVVNKINALAPEFACFTGDIVEDAAHLDKALAILTGIKCPLYGIPGNHDHWSNADFPTIKRAFEKISGAWLVNEQVTLSKGSVHLVGMDNLPLALPPIRVTPRFSSLIIRSGRIRSRRIGSTSSSPVIPMADRCASHFSVR